MRRPVKNRKERKPDSKYESVEVTRLINYMMLHGKKDVARKIVYRAFDYINEKENKEPVQVYKEAIKNVGPLVEVRSRRIGGANYQVPREVKPDRRESLAVRWILEEVRKKEGKAAWQFLGDELIAASKGEGEAVKKKENTHRMAEANKAFAHFSW